MDKNIVSFIESIEPDFSYQGTEGAMALIVESNDNMLNIESYLDSLEAAIQEGSSSGIEPEKKVSTTEWIKNKAKNAIDYIIKAIKVAIAKIKGLFFTMVKKLKMLYAQAAKKIADMLTKVSTSSNAASVDVDVKYLDVKSMALKGYIDKFKPEDTPYFKTLEDDALTAGEDKSLQDTTPTTAEILKSCLGDKSMEDIRKECLTEESGRVQLNGILNTLKAFYDMTVMGLLNKLYKRIMDNKKSMLATISKLRTADGANRHTISYANKVVNAINAASTQFFNTVFGIVVTGLHQRIKLCMSMIKARMFKSASDTKDKVSNKASEAKKTVTDKATELKNKITSNKESVTIV